MITKTAIGLGTTALFALPHAMDYMDDNKSLPGAALSTAGDIGAWKASDYAFDKIFKPKQYNFFQNNPNAKWYQPWKKMHLTKGFEWAKAARNGVGRLAFSLPFFAASSMLTDGINNTFLPGKNQRLAQQYYANMQQNNVGAQPTIQKQAAEVPTKTLAIGTGALRAARLSDKDKAALRDAYDLSDSSNLVLRNAGRGFVGGTLGGLTGGTLGSAIGMKRLGLRGIMPGAIVGSLIGSELGITKATDKYSKTGVADAKKILKARDPKYDLGTEKDETRGSLLKHLTTDLGAAAGYAKGTMPIIRKDDARMLGYGMQQSPKRKLLLDKLVGKYNSIPIKTRGLAGGILGGGLAYGAYTGAEKLYDKLKSKVTA